VSEFSLIWIAMHMQSTVALMTEEIRCRPIVG